VARVDVLAVIRIASCFSTFPRGPGTLHCCCGLSAAACSTGTACWLLLLLQEDKETRKSTCSGLAFR
jgi:hypothetical protein